MKSCSGALTTLLASNVQLVRADLLTLTQANGTVTRLTNADVALTVGGNTFVNAPSFTRGRVSTTIGLTAASVDVTILCDPVAHLLGGIPWPQAARIGVLDGARVEIDTFLSASWADTSAGSINLWSGRIATVAPSRYSVKCTVLADIELLNSPMPRNLYQQPCLHALYDAGCTLARATYQVSSTAIAGSTSSVITTSSLGQATGYFDLGILAWTSGANAGLETTVKQFVQSGAGTQTVALANPLPNAPQVGDAFHIWPGCDRQQATCSSKFSNLAHFRGFPYTPAPESAH